MISFRRKFFFSDLALFLIFLVALFPLVNFNLDFLKLGAFLLFLHSLMTWAIIYRLSTPIQKILDAILPYQQGRVEFLPRIVVHKGVDSDEFNQLALTLNSLSEKIENQIAHLTYAKKETEGILQSLGEGVIALDRKANVTFANQISCQMLGVSCDAILGHPFSEIALSSGGLHEKCHELVLQTLQTSESITETWKMTEGPLMFLHLTTMPRIEQNGAILMFQDKTSDHRVVEMGKDFIANASHELKTPLTIIRGFAETLQDIPNLSPKMLKEITGKIVKTCGRLNHLVKSLLVLADVENLSEDRFRSTDLVSLLENCTHMLLIAHPNVSLSIQNKLKRSVVLADSDLLDLALMNLLENSVKYSSEQAQIEVSLEEEGASVILSVTDRGIGIPEKDLPHIFNRFYTVDKARSRKSGGAGLGLSIVKTIVDKHKGQLQVSSQLDQGSTFKISLPIKNL